jgi:hypothetical protein
MAYVALAGALGEAAALWQAARLAAKPRPVASFSPLETVV